MFSDKCRRASENASNKKGKRCLHQQINIYQSYIEERDKLLKYWNDRTIKTFTRVQFNGRLGADISTKVRIKEAGPRRGSVVQEVSTVTRVPKKKRVIPYLERRAVKTEAIIRASLGGQAGGKAVRGGKSPIRCATTATVVQSEKHRGIIARVNAIGRTWGIVKPIVAPKVCRLKAQSLGTDCFHNINLCERGFRTVESPPDTGWNFCFSVVAEVEISWEVSSGLRRIRLNRLKRLEEHEKRRRVKLESFFGWKALDLKENVMSNVLGQLEGMLAKGRKMRLSNDNLLKVLSFVKTIYERTQAVSKMVEPAEENRPWQRTLCKVRLGTLLKRIRKICFGHRFDVADRSKADLWSIVTALVFQELNICNYSFQTPQPLPPEDKSQPEVDIVIVPDVEFFMVLGDKNFNLYVAQP